MNSMKRLLKIAKPFVAVIFLQVGLAGMDVLSKAALNHGMSNYVFGVYRHAVATIVIAPFALLLDKNGRQKMTLSIFFKILLLSLLEPVIDQNLYLLAMKYTSATFAAAMCNMLPAITFIIAWMLRLEKVRINEIRSQTKILGTIITIAGAMIMTFVRGPSIGLLTRKHSSHYDHLNKSSSTISLHDAVKGSIMMSISCLGWACFIILQAVTLEAYPAELSLTTWICLLGTGFNTLVALAVEGVRSSVWSVSLDTKFLAAVYSGIFCSGLAYYIQGLIMKERGPVFVTAFSPLSMVIVAIMSCSILAEQMTLGRVIASVIIVAGLYLVVWGKARDNENKPTDIDDDETLKMKQAADIKTTGDCIIDLPCLTEVVSTEKRPARHEDA